jgi:hypothetical protein
VADTFTVQQRRRTLVCETRQVWHAALRASPDGSPADWLAPRLTGASGTVTGTVPAGYDAYARIFHFSDGS